jgi:predicted NBD/HSP70 family sugar kinase
MNSRSGKRPRILVIDVGGSHVKCHLGRRSKPTRFRSGPTLRPEQMVKKVLKITKGWRYEVVSMGYPGVVRRGAIAAEPHNLGPGWVGFDFRAAFGRPVRIINDAAMQALGAYTGGSMLFLGLGTGLGTTMIIDHVIAAMELGHLPYRSGRNYEDHVGEPARKRLGNKHWRLEVERVLEDLRQALLPEYVVLGGGNVSHLRSLPAQTRRGGNADAFAGGLRLWERKRSTYRHPKHLPRSKG